ncbi:FAD-dependent oxidoreductase [Sesbania bispinosa]|nr:FAD-dependent oxidoreductase [Sesbania bispinosa]
MPRFCVIMENVMIRMCGDQVKIMEKTIIRPLGDDKMIQEGIIVNDQLEATNGSIVLAGPRASHVGDHVALDLSSSGPRVLESNSPGLRASISNLESINVSNGLAGPRASSLDREGLQQNGLGRVVAFGPKFEVLIRLVAKVVCHWMHQMLGRACHIWTMKEWEVLEEKLMLGQILRPISRVSAKVMSRWNHLYLGREHWLHQMVKWRTLKI